MIFRLSGTLRRYVGYDNQFEVEAETLRQALELLTSDKPTLKPLLYDNSGGLRNVYRVFINSEQADHNDLDRPLAKSDRVDIVTSIAGG